MQKIGILVCGNSGIDYENVSFPYEIIRSTLIIDGKEFEDYVDITADEFYKMLEENPNVDVKTAQTSTGLIVEKLEKMKKEGYTDVIAIIISSKLSGTYQNVMLAKDIATDINVFVVDSLSVTFGQLVQVYKAAELIEKGLSAEEIFNYLEEFKKRLGVYVLVDTLKFLVKNGRLSTTSGIFGNLLKIKPLLHITEDGRLVPLERIRTFSRAKKRLLEIAREEIDKGVEGFYLAYTNNKELAEEIRDEILQYSPDLKISIHPLTPVVGAHAGPGTCGFGVLRKE